MHHTSDSSHVLLPFRLVREAAAGSQAFFPFQDKIRLHNRFKKLKKIEYKKLLRDHKPTDMHQVPYRRWQESQTSLDGPSICTSVTKTFT